MNLGLDPVHRKADQAHADLWVEALHRFHQANIAFLDQVGQRQAVAFVTACDVDHEAKVGQHQRFRGLEILFTMQALGNFALVFGTEHGDTRNRRDIRFDAAGLGDRELGIGKG